jgi:hypothetical protein
MGYAINAQNGARAVISESDCGVGETYVDELPSPWPPAPTADEQWKNYQVSAQSALDATDVTVHRVIEAVALGKTTLTAADVVTFMEYRAALRAILSESQPETIPTALPTKPAYPANT